MGSPYSQTFLRAPARIDRNRGAKLSNADTCAGSEDKWCLFGAMRVSEVILMRIYAQMTRCAPDFAGPSSVQALLFAQQPPARKHRISKLFTLITAMKRC
jgi:hypothetical protein